MFSKQRLPCHASKSLKQKVIFGYSSSLPGNVNFPYKRVIYTVFRASPVSAVSQNKQFRIVLMPPKRHIWGWHNLSSIPNF